MDILCGSLIWQAGYIAALKDCNIDVKRIELIAEILKCNDGDLLKKVEEYLNEVV